MEIPQNKFEGYAIVEIMGHQSAAGFVTTEAFGGVVLFHVVQLEQPPIERTLERNEYIDGHCLWAGSRVRVSRERAECYIGPASIYRMTPCTEEDCLRKQSVKVEVLWRAAPVVVAAAEDGDENPYAKICTSAEVQSEDEQSEDEQSDAEEGDIQF
jgi:hypothetical protein